MGICQQRLGLMESPLSQRVFFLFINRNRARLQRRSARLKMQPFARAPQRVDLNATVTLCLHPHSRLGDAIAAPIQLLHLRRIHGGIFTLLTQQRGRRMRRRERQQNIPRRSPRRTRQRSPRRTRQRSPRRTRQRRPQSPASVHSTQFVTMSSKLS